MQWKWNFVVPDGELRFYMMKNKPKHFIPILCMEILSKFLNRGKIVSFKNLQIVL